MLKNHIMAFGEKVSLRLFIQKKHDRIFKNIKKTEWSSFMKDFTGLLRSDLFNLESCNFPSISGQLHLFLRQRHDRIHAGTSFKRSSWSNAGLLSLRWTNWIIIFDFIYFLRFRFQIKFWHIYHRMHCFIVLCKIHFWYQKIFKNIIIWYFVRFKTKKINFISDGGWCYLSYPGRLLHGVNTNRWICKIFI